MELCLRLRRFCLEGDRTRSARSVGQGLTPGATRAPQIFLIVHLYESKGAYGCHPDVSIGMGLGVML